MNSRPGCREFRRYADGVIDLPRVFDLCSTNKYKQMCHWVTFTTCKSSCQSLFAISWYSVQSYLTTVVTPQRCGNYPCQMGAHYHQAVWQMKQRHLDNFPPSSRIQVVLFSLTWFGHSYFFNRRYILTSWLTQPCCASRECEKSRFLILALIEAASLWGLLRYTLNKVVGR